MFLWQKFMMDVSLNIKKNHQYDFDIWSDLLSLFDFDKDLLICCEDYTLISASYSQNHVSSWSIINLINILFSFSCPKFLTDLHVVVFLLLSSVSYMMECFEFQLFLIDLSTWPNWNVRNICEFWDNYLLIETHDLIDFIKLVSSVDISRHLDYGSLLTDLYNLF